MKRLSTLIVAMALPVALAATALAQEGKTLGTVVNGNTTTVFKAAGPGGIEPFPDRVAGRTDTFAVDR